MDWEKRPGERLSTEDFERLNQFIEGYCGVPVPREMKALVEAELRRRARALALGGIHDYCQRLTSIPLCSQWEKEIVDLIDRITNTHTVIWSESGE